MRGGRPRGRSARLLGTEIATAECLREKIGKAVAANLTTFAATDDQRVASELDQNLAARSARRRRLGGRRVDGDGGDAASAVRDRLVNGVTLGAHRQTVGCVFHIGADEYLSGVRQNGGTHCESGIGGVGMRSSAAREALEQRKLGG